jgi:uncharacterized alkaline shock family protein YloU
MNIFNRVLVILYLLFSAVFVFLLIGAVAFQVEAAGALVNLAEALRNITTPAKWLMALVLLVVLIIDIVLLLLELVPPTTSRTVRIKQVTGGEAEVFTESIEGRLAYNIDQLADVVRVVAKVVDPGKNVEGVEVVLDVETSPDIDVPAKTEEIMEVTRRIVEDRMGLDLAQVRVNIRHAPFPKRPRETAGPTQQAEI